MSLPTEWAYFTQQNSTGIAAEIDLLGAPGVRHVLEDLSAHAATLNLSFTPSIQVFDGGTLVLSRVLFVNATGAGNWSSDGADVSGPLIGSPGSPMTIKFNAVAGANTVEFVAVKGYDV